MQPSVLDTCRASAESTPMGITSAKWARSGLLSRPPERSADTHVDSPGPSRLASRASPDGNVAQSMLPPGFGAGSATSTASASSRPPRSSSRLSATSAATTSSLEQLDVHVGLFALGEQPQHLVVEALGLLARYDMLPPLSPQNVQCDCSEKLVL